MNKEVLVIGHFSYDNMNFPIYLDYKSLKVFGYLQNDTRVFEMELILFKYDKTVKISFLKIIEKKRRKGIGTKVLHYVETYFKSKGIIKIYGEIVESDNFDCPKKVSNFYMKSDYEIEPKRIGMQVAIFSKKINQ